MYNISFHLKLYRIIYWTKKYSPKLRFHNKVVYKCKSLSNWWLWACKSTFYLIKKGRIFGPCETKHDKPNRLAVHWTLHFKWKAIFKLSFSTLCCDDFWNLCYGVEERLVKFAVSRFALQKDKGKSTLP